MTAIIKRELKSYFLSPVGYVFLAVFYLFAGLYFFSYTLLYNTADLSGVFSQLFTVVLFLVPILTMRLFSEERRHRTDQALLTAPIRLPALVMGKFLASVLMFLTGMLVLPVFGLVITFFTMPNWAEIVGSFLGMLLLAMALISIGMFISSLTESQVVAAIGSFAVSLFLVMFSSMTPLVQDPQMLRLARGLSFMARYHRFTAGIFDLTGVLFFLSVCAIFIFLTVRVLEKRRWN